MHIAVCEDLYLEFDLPAGSYLLKGEPVCTLYSDKEPSQELIARILNHLNFYTSQEIDRNAYYGYMHLTEVAVKALSPSIADPGTAVLCIDALTDLFAEVMQHPWASSYADKSGCVRISIIRRSFHELFDHCVYQIWDYGKTDRTVKAAFLQMLKKLRTVANSSLQEQALNRFEAVLEIPEVK